MLDKVKACAKGAALATGTTLEIDQSWAGYDSLKNNIPIENTIKKKKLKLLSIDETPDKMQIL